MKKIFFGLLGMVFISVSGIGFWMHGKGILEPYLHSVYHQFHTDEHIDHDYVVCSRNHHHNDHDEELVVLSDFESLSRGYGGKV